MIYCFISIIFIIFEEGEKIEKVIFVTPLYVYAFIGVFLQKGF